MKRANKVYNLPLNNEQKAKIRVIEGAYARDTAEYYIALARAVYGDYCLGDMTLEEVSIILNTTRERVRQIENTAIKKLKNPKIGKLLIEYYKG
jgi:DNA-directed RNA polymerase sigma subunit (sigma70/sigma32)